MFIWSQRIRYRENNSTHQTAIINTGTWAVDSPNNCEPLPPTALRNNYLQVSRNDAANMIRDNSFINRFLWKPQTRKFNTISTTLTRITNTNCHWTYNEDHNNTNNEQNAVNETNWVSATLDNIDIPIHKYHQQHLYSNNLQ